MPGKYVFKLVLILFLFNRVCATNVIGVFKLKIKPNSQLMG